MLADYICYAADGISKDLLMKLQGLLKLLLGITGIADSQLQMCCCCCCKVKYGEPCGGYRQVVLGRRRAKTNWHSNITLLVNIQIFKKFLSILLHSHSLLCLSLSPFFPIPSCPTWNIHLCPWKMECSWIVYRLVVGFVSEDSVVSSPAGSGCS